jgi:hypothetical protein
MPEGSSRSMGLVGSSTRSVNWTVTGFPPTQLHLNDSAVHRIERTSLQFLMHPTLAPEDVNAKVAAAEKGLEAATDL